MLEESAVYFTNNYKNSFIFENSSHLFETKSVSTPQFRNYGMKYCVEVDSRHQRCVSAFTDVVPNPRQSLWLYKVSPAVFSLWANYPFALEGLNSESSIEESSPEMKQVLTNFFTLMLDATGPEDLKKFKVSIHKLHQSFLKAGSFRKAAAILKKELDELLSLTDKGVLKKDWCFKLVYNRLWQVDLLKTFDVSSQKFLELQNAQSTLAAASLVMGDEKVSSLQQLAFQNLLRTSEGFLLYFETTLKFKMLDVFLKRPISTCRKDFYCKAFSEKQLNKALHLLVKSAAQRLCEFFYDDNYHAIKFSPVVMMQLIILLNDFKQLAVAYKMKVGEKKLEQQIYTYIKSNVHLDSLVALGIEAQQLGDFSKLEMGKIDWPKVDPYFYKRRFLKLVSLEPSSLFSVLTQQAFKVRFDAFRDQIQRPTFTCGQYKLTLFELERPDRTGERLMPYGHFKHQFSLKEDSALQTVSQFLSYLHHPHENPGEVSFLNHIPFQVKTYESLDHYTGKDLNPLFQEFKNYFSSENMEPLSIEVVTNAGDRSVSLSLPSPSNLPLPLPIDERVEVESQEGTTCNFELFQNFLMLHLAENFTGLRELELKYIHYHILQFLMIAHSQTEFLRVQRIYKGQREGCIENEKTSCIDLKIELIEENMQNGDVFNNVGLLGKVTVQAKHLVPCTVKVLKSDQSKTHKKTSFELLKLSQSELETKFSFMFDFQLLERNFEVYDWTNDQHPLAINSFYDDYGKFEFKLDVVPQDVDFVSYFNMVKFLPKLGGVV